MNTCEHPVSKVIAEFGGIIFGTCEVCGENTELTIGTGRPTIELVGGTVTGPNPYCNYPEVTK